MRIYLDNCCFNRPFDDQSQHKIRLESEAKLVIQDRIINGKLELIWSFILDLENNANPFDERRVYIAKWESMAIETVVASDLLLTRAKEYVSLGLRSKDALHLASAVFSDCHYFITTDNGILNKTDVIKPCKIINPVEFFTKELL
jgi:predicted nucleic acid-binding protein